LPCRLTGGGQIGQHITLLRAQGEHDGQHPGDELATLCALRAEAGSPPDHGRAQGTLRRVVGRLNTFHPHKQPEGFLDFEQLATRPRGPRPGRLLPTRGLVGRPLCELLLDSCANLDDGRRKCRPCQRPSRTRCHNLNNWRAYSSNPSPIGCDSPPRSATF
jgi:hypothetical protein